MVGSCDGGINVMSKITPIMTLLITKARGIKTIARPITLGLCLCAKFLLRGVVFYNKTVTHCISIETPTAIYFEFMELFWGKSAIYYFEQLNFIL